MSSRFAYPRFSRRTSFTQSRAALKATLVWTDPAVEMISVSPLINDLDLRILLPAPNYQFFGNG